MKNRLTFLAAILFILWVVAFFGFGIGGFMHLLLGVACIALILRLEEPIFLPKTK